MKIIAAFVVGCIVVAIAGCDCENEPVPQNPPVDAGTDGSCGEPVPNCTDANCLPQTC